MAKYRIIYTETHEVVVDLGDVSPYVVKKALELGDSDVNVWELSNSSPETITRSVEVEEVKTRKAAGSSG